MRCGRSRATACVPRVRVEQLAGVSSREPPRLEAFHSIQLALSAIDRLEVRGRDSAGLHVLVTGHGLDLARPDDRAPARGAQRGPAVHVRLGAGRRRASRVRVQDRGRDRRARRQHDAPAFGRSATTSCSGSRCRPTPPRPSCSRTRAGRASASSPKRTRTRSTTKRSTRRGAAYVVAALNGDVDNYADLKALEALHFPAEITTDAKVIPALVSRRITKGAEPIEAFRSTVAVVRGIGCDRGADRRRRRTGCCSRSGAAARRCTSGSPTTRTSSRASRTVSSRSATGTCVSTARRCWCRASPAHRARSSAVSAAFGIERWCYDGSPLPVRDDELKRPEITHARRGSRRRAALPAEGDLEGAGIVPQDAAGPARRAGRASRSSASGRGAARFDRRAAARRQPAARHRDGSGHRGHRGPGHRARVAPLFARTAADGRSDRGDRTLRVRARRRHVRHARRHHLAVGHDGRHEPHRRSRTGAGRGRDRHRQPAPERPRRQERRRALHVRRSRRGDERRVDQGVLRADRGGLPARVRDCGGARPGLGRRPHRPPRDPRRAPGSAERDARTCSERRSTIALAAQRHALLASLVGSGRQRDQPGRRRRDPDQAVGALLQVDLV